MADINVSASQQVDGLDLLNTVTAGGTLLKYWNGASWEAKPLKYWNGAAWVEKTLKYWNGVAWVGGAASTLRHTDSATTRLITDIAVSVAESVSMLDITQHLDDTGLEFSLVDLTVYINAGESIGSVDVASHIPEDKLVQLLTDIIATGSDSISVDIKDNITSGSASVALL